MIQGCADKGYDAVEYDNLDSWTRFDGTPLADEVPFEKPDALAYAKLLASRAHALGLAVAQKNTADITPHAVRQRRLRLRDRRGVLPLSTSATVTSDVYGNHVIEIEYRLEDFSKACSTVGDRDLGRPARPPGHARRLAATTSTTPAETQRPA